MIRPRRSGTSPGRSGLLAVAVLSAAVFLLAPPTLASAHAVFVASFPASGSVLRSAPTEVRLRFSEAVQPFGGGVAVVGPSGQPVALGPVRVDQAELVAPVKGPLEPGTYTVRWRVIADDTHPTRGQLVFSVGAPSAVPTAETEVGGVAPIGLALQTAGRWLHFVGLALGFGTLLFGLLSLDRDDRAG